MKDHSNPLSRPYPVRLAEQGFIYNVKLPDDISPYTLDDVNLWLAERGYTKSKVHYVMSNWSYYFKDEKIAFLFRLKWS